MRENIPSMTTRPRVLLALLFAGLALPMVARAAPYPGLYEARVPVADRTPAALKAAFQQALSAVLVRVTGARQVTGPLAAILPDAGQYVQQYHYESAPPDPDAPPPAAGQPPALVLWVSFSAKVVGQAVHAAHMPLWGPERPRTLLWLALQEGQSSRLLSAGDGSPLVQTLLTAAQQRGVELVLPQMDGPDRNALGVPDITNSNTDRIRAASTRYRADAVLVGSITPFGNGQYAARWQLLTGTGLDAWQTPPGDEGVTALDGVETAADRYAKSLAVAADAGDLDDVQVAVDGVTGLDAYAKVLAYLNGLTPVRAVRVLKVEQGSVYYSIDVHGSLDNLQSAALLGGLLAPGDAATAVPAATGAAPAAVPAAPLRYRYQPGP